MTQIKSPLDFISPLAPLNEVDIPQYLTSKDKYWFEVIGMAMSSMQSEGCTPDTFISRQYPMDFYYWYSTCGRECKEIDPLKSHNLGHIEMDTNLTLLWDSKTPVSKNPFAVMSLVCL